MIVLIDERPEEVTDFRQFLAGRGEIWSSSNDQENASHVRLAKLVIERAKRLVESGRDVFIPARFHSLGSVAPSTSAPRATP